MSTFNVQSLKAATDTTIESFLREAENGTTANINHDTLLEFGLIAKGVKIINNDAAANLDIRLHNVLGTILVIPPSSDLEINEWFSQIFVQPDNVTGNFQLTLELVEPKDALRVKK